MSAALVIAASIPAYMAAGIALVLGLGWVTSLALLVGIGTAVTLWSGIWISSRSTLIGPVADLGQALPRHS